MNSILNGDAFETSFLSDDYNDDYRTLSEKQLALVFKYIAPASNENPWKRPDVRYRNQLLIHLLSSTGMRRGELIRIRVSDLGRSKDTGRYYLTIRVGEDLEDKRINKPSAKTSGRRIPLHQSLYRMIEEYIISHRSKVNFVEKNPYLFVTHYSGQPQKGSQGLSLASVNKICLQLSSVLGFSISPHMFRHAWNDRFSQHAENLIKAGKTTEAKVEADRRKLMGWCSMSEMAERYARKYEDERAIKIGLQLQDKNYTDGGKVEVENEFLQNKPSDR